MPEPRFEDDFGLTGLTRRFHQDWSNEHTVRELVADTADIDDGASTILEDVLRLLDSAVPTWAITVLWQAATGRYYDLEYLGIEGRDWLREIADICADRIRQDDPAFTVRAPEPAPDALTGAVLDEILVAAPALTAATMKDNGHAVSGVVSALQSAVTHVGPELGFRFFLAVMYEHCVPITQAQYDRYLALGEGFGYGFSHLSDSDFVTELKA